MQCLYMENNKNYQKILQNTIKTLQNSDKKPKLLLHVCCGPCSTIPLKELDNYFDITLIFNNSNIYPKDEHDRRFGELKKYLKDINKNYEIVFFDYDNISYNKSLEPYAENKEGHERCRVCFRKRLEQGFEYAQNHGFDYYGTVMTISRYKNAQDINKIGAELEQKYTPVKWLFADFKKNNGYEDSLLIIKEHNMYFQEYCGCIYSFTAYQKKHQK